MGDFRKLNVREKSKDIAVKIITEYINFKKDFGLKDQMRRSAVSISSNIAEGDERFTNKEAIRFLYIANGSVAELITQVIIAYEIGYITLKENNLIVNELEEISKMIKALINYRNKNV